MKIVIDYFSDKELTKYFKPDNIIIRYKVNGVKFKSEAIVGMWKILERKDKYIYVEEISSQEKSELNIDKIIRSWDKLEIVEGEKVIETFTSDSWENY
jgi:hypothetical protein